LSAIALLITGLGNKLLDDISASPVGGRYDDVAEALPGDALQVGKPGRIGQIIVFGRNDLAIRKLIGPLDVKSVLPEIVSASNLDSDELAHDD
jgi:hypothetical protein